jgi:hypothetical protein
MSDTSPRWLSVLNEEDLHFLRRFLLVSGSLKALAKEYGISYPTVRARLDRLIAKVRAAEDPASDDPFHRLVRTMVADGALSAVAARTLLQTHAESLADLKGDDHDQT